MTPLIRLTIVCVVLISLSFSPTVHGAEPGFTDAEYILGGKPHPNGADGTTWLGRVLWSQPNSVSKR